MKNYYLNTFEGIKNTEDYNVFHYGMDKVLEARLNIWGYPEDDERLSYESIFNDIRNYCVKHHMTWNDFMNSERYLTEDFEF